MIICTTPILGFSPTIRAANYPYTVGLGLPNPQLGSTVHAVDTSTGNGFQCKMAETSTGIYGWQVQPPTPTP